MAPGGAASRSNQLNIGDQLIGINGISLVGLPLSAAQHNIKVSGREGAAGGRRDKMSLAEFTSKIGILPNLLCKLATKL